MQFFEYIAQKRCYYYSTIFFCRKDKNRKNFLLFSPNFPAILTKRLSITKKNMNKILALNTNKDEETIERDTERDNFMSATDALNYGLIDKVISKKES